VTPGKYATGLVLILVVIVITLTVVGVLRRGLEDRSLTAKQKWARSFPKEALMERQAIAMERQAAALERLASCVSSNGLEAKVKETQRKETE
jgi:hypothetical protein